MFTKPSELLICKLVNENRNCVVPTCRRLDIETHAKIASVLCLQFGHTLGHLSSLTSVVHLCAFGFCKWWNDTISNSSIRGELTFFFVPFLEYDFAKIRYASQRDSIFISVASHRNKHFPHFPRNTLEQTFVFSFVDCLCRTFFFTLRRSRGSVGIKMLAEACLNGMVHRARYIFDF